MRSRILLGCGLVTAALLVFESCKDVAGPVAVEAVTVSVNSLDLVRGETEQLSAIAHDAAGDPLDRTINWISSAPDVATVTNGLVAAVSPGNALITASVEGKSASLPVSVDDGGVVGPSGGTISNIGGSVQLSVPPAAVLSTSRLFIIPANNFPASARLVRGSMFEIRNAPRGRSSPEPAFSQAVTLTIRYDPADIGHTNESALSIFRAVGSGWQQLDQSRVNTALHTVAASVMSFGVYAILVEPAVASVGISPSAPALRVRDQLNFSATVRDADGNNLSGRAIAWSTSDATILKLDAATGAATAVAPGTVVVTAACEGMSATTTIHVTAGPAANIKMGDGDKQSALAGATLPISPSVIVTDLDGFAVSGVHVAFSVTAGGGSITGSDAVTDDNGVARVGSWTLGSGGALNTLAATLSGAAGSPVAFTANAQPIISAPPAPPAAIAIFAGDGQVAPPNTAVAIRPAVKVSDASGKPVAGITVTFSIRSGEGSITGALAVSDSAGIATVGSWTLGSGGGNSLFATLNNVSGSPLIFVANATTNPAPAPGPAPPPPPPSNSGPPVAVSMFAGDGQSAVAGTAVPVRPAVKIIDANGVGVSGVTVTFSIRSGAGTLNQPVVTSDGNGIATVGAWFLGSIGGNSLFATASGLQGSPIIFVATATAPLGSTVRIVTFGDSNTDLGFVGTNPNPVVASYISSAGDIRLSPDAPNSPYQLAGKIEAKWRAQSSKTFIAVNHGISATSTGGGRTPRGAPNAQTQVGGITRFLGEVLGSAYPWNGGEPTNTFYASGSINRVKAFSPGPDDFVYVSMGTNDQGAAIDAAGTAANLEWMIDQWVNSGHGADHFILTTLAPASGNTSIPQTNTLIRALAAKRSVRLVDLAARTSNDNGATWESSADTVDGLHYSEAIRDWIADQVASYLLAIAPK